MRVEYLAAYSVAMRVIPCKHDLQNICRLDVYDNNPPPWPFINLGVGSVNLIYKDVL
jgi:hypothetical protein